jgi:hypothetical protein
MLRYHSRFCVAISYIASMERCQTGLWRSCTISVPGMLDALRPAALGFQEPRDRTTNEVQISEVRHNVVDGTRCAQLVLEGEVGPVRWVSMSMRMSLRGSS